MQPEYDLTDDQKKAYAENEADFAELEKQIRSLAETAKSRLTASGLRHGPGTEFYCYLCSCREFQGSDHQCTRSTCRHSRLRHEGYT